MKNVSEKWQLLIIMHILFKIIISSTINRFKNRGNLLKQILTNNMCNCYVICLIIKIVALIGEQTIVNWYVLQK